MPLELRESRLAAPELEILGITTTFGDTETRAKPLDRMLGEIGRQNIPVAVGQLRLWSSKRVSTWDVRGSCRSMSMTNKCSTS